VLLELPLALPGSEEMALVLHLLVSPMHPFGGRTMVAVSVPFGGYFFDFSVSISVGKRTTRTAHRVCGISGTLNQRIQTTPECILTNKLSFTI
jgi:hypothetical protein